MKKAMQSNTGIKITGVVINAIIIGTLLVGLTSGFKLG